MATASHLPAPPSPRLLLRQAVQRAETEDQVDGVDADDGAVAEQLGEDAERDAVVRVVESRDQFLNNV